MKLQDYLKKHGIKQHQFAALLEVSRPTINNWLAGRRMPRPNHLQAIKDATKGKVTPNDFL